MGNRHEEGDQVLIGAPALLPDDHGARDRFPLLRYPHSGSGNIDARHRRERLGLHHVGLGLERVIRAIRLVQQSGDPARDVSHGQPRRIQLAE